MSKMLHVDFESYVEVHHDTRGCDGPYSGHREDSVTLIVKGLCRKPIEAFGERLLVTDEMYEADGLWLVTIRYSTGDTFSNRSGEYYFVAVFESEEDAAKVAKEIRKDYENKDKKYEYSFMPSIDNPNYSENGISGCYKGYFERLETVDIQYLVVGESKKKMSY